jgi:hypothetical protein
LSKHNLLAVLLTESVVAIGQAGEASDTTDSKLSNIAFQGPFYSHANWNRGKEQGISLEARENNSRLEIPFPKHCRR